MRVKVGIFLDTQSDQRINDILILYIVSCTSFGKQKHKLFPDLLSLFITHLYISIQNLHLGTFKRCNVETIIVLHTTKYTCEPLEIAIQLNSQDQSNQIFVNVSVYAIAVTRVSAAIEDKYLILRLITDNDFYDSENCVYCVLLFDFDLHW